MKIANQFFKLRLEDMGVRSSYAIGFGMGTALCATLLSESKNWTAYLVGCAVIILGCIAGYNHSQNAKTRSKKRAS
jgi:hypothetical protein